MRVAALPPLTPLVLVVPMPPSPNRSGRSRNPFTVAREKREYGATLDLYASEAWRKSRRVSTSDPKAATKVFAVMAEKPWYAPEPPAAPIHRALVTVTATVVGAMNDADNLEYRVKKWLGDWLVTRGYVATDRPHRQYDGAGLAWAAFPEQTVTRKEPAHITLTIQPSER